MANLDLRKNLLRISCVDEISQTVVNGAIKHFRIRAYSDVPELTSILTTLWPFCEVTCKEASTVVDFLVKPEELAIFSVKLANVSPVGKKRRVKILIPLDGTVDEALRKKVEAGLRSSDKVIWSGEYLAVVTDSQAAVRSIRTRISKQLKTALAEARVL